MKKTKYLWLAFLFWVVFGVGCYGYFFPHPNSSAFLKASIFVLFCVGMVYTTQVVLGLFTNNQRHFALALLSGCFLLDLWSITCFSENQSLREALLGTPEREPLIGELGVFGLIFALSVLWYTPERPYPRWRATLSLFISMAGLIGIFHMQKTGFAVWHPMASIAVYGAWLLCLSEMLCHWLKRLFIGLKSMCQRIKGWVATVFCSFVAFACRGYQRLCEWTLGILASARQCQKKLTTGVLGLLKKCLQQIFQFLGWCWEGLEGLYKKGTIARLFFLKLLASLVESVLRYILPNIIKAAVYIAAWLKTTFFWLMARGRQYYPSLKTNAACLLCAIVARIRAMLQ